MLSEGTLSESADGPLGISSAALIGIVHGFSRLSAGELLRTKNCCNLLSVSDTAQWVLRTSGQVANLEVC